jgi:hypothetical protein
LEVYFSQRPDVTALVNSLRGRSIGIAEHAKQKHASAGKPGARRLHWGTPFPPSLVRKTLKEVLTEYGTVALVLYLVIFAIVLGASYFAIRSGWAPDSAAGKTGTFAAAYIVTKLTQPIRIAVTVALTPVVARLYERVRGSPSQQ